MSINWPAAFLLAVLAVCASLLTWKGIIPSHFFFTVAGAIIGYVIPKSAAATLRGWDPHIVGSEKRDLEVAMVEKPKDEK